MPSGNSKGRRDTLNDATSEPDPNDDTPLDAAAFLRLAVTDDHSSQASWSDWWRASPRAFGGQLVAHSIVAAGRCAPAGWTCHSVHVSFVGAGKMQRTTYKVTTLRKGRTLSLYQVKALEADGTVVVVATVGFHDAASERQRGAQPLCTSAVTPGVPPPPSQCPPPPVASTSARRAAEWPAERQLNEDGSLSWVGWPSSPQRLGPLEQAAALAFLSDLRGAEVASYAHRRTRQLAMHTSLDHTLHFHSAPPQPLGWVLVQLEAPWAADGRAVVRMKMWSPEGELLATAVQEALLRTEPRAPVGAAPAGSAAGGGYDQDGPPHTSSKL